MEQVMHGETQQNVQTLIEHTKPITNIQSNQNPKTRQQQQKEKLNCGTGNRSLTEDDHLPR